jgi:hypothetical protein
MKKELILNYNLNNDFISQWIPLVIRSMSEHKYNGRSIQISWKKVSGNYDGDIAVHLSNDESKYSLTDSFTIDTADNSEDVIICDISTNAEFIRFKFTKYQILSGKLEILIIYERD